MQLHSLLPSRFFFSNRPAEYQRKEAGGKEASAGRECGHLYLNFSKYVDVFLWVSLIWNLDSLLAWCWMSIFWWLTSIIKWKKCKETLKDWLTKNIFAWFNKGTATMQNDWGVIEQTKRDMPWLLHTVSQYWLMILANMHYLCLLIVHLLNTFPCEWASRW